MEWAQGCGWLTVRVLIDTETCIHFQTHTLTQLTHTCTQHSPAYAHADTHKHTHLNTHPQAHSPWRTHTPVAHRVHPTSAQPPSTRMRRADTHTRSTLPAGRTVCILRVTRLASEPACAMQQSWVPASCDRAEAVGPPARCSGSFGPSCRRVGLFDILRVLSVQWGCSQSLGTAVEGAARAAPRRCPLWPCRHCSTEASSCCVTGCVALVSWPQSSHTVSLRTGGLAPALWPGLRTPACSSPGRRASGARGRTRLSSRAEPCPVCLTVMRVQGSFWARDVSLIWDSVGAAQRSS